MQLGISGEMLKRGLTIVNRAVANRATLPITQNILLEASNKTGQLRLAATNLEISIETQLPVMVEQGGAITIPARMLVEWVDNVSAQTISLSNTPGERVLELQAGRSKATFNGMDAADFPPLPDLSDAPRVEYGRDDLLSRLGRVNFACAREESRPVLTGVYWTVTAHGYTVAAADGFRLAVDSGEVKGGDGQGATAIIPRRAISELRRWHQGDGPVSVAIGPSQAEFELNDPFPIRLMAQTIVGVFPEYEKLIPERHDTWMTVRRAALLAALKTADVFTGGDDGKNRAVRLLAEPSSGETPPRLVVRAHSEGVGQVETSVDLESLEGAPSRMAFNAGYLLEAVSAIQHHLLVLSWRDAGGQNPNPGVIRMEGNPHYTHVVMPMNVLW